MKKRKKTGEMAGKEEVDNEDDFVMASSIF